MNVILVNGSPDKAGCTFTALSEVAGQLEAAGIETSMFHLGKTPISGCRDCGYCMEHDHCVIDDAVNEFLLQAAKADGFVFGSPVHYASAGGSITAFMDRVFFSAGPEVFRGKPAAAVVSCRRAGSTASLDQLTKYFTISQMPVVSSRYWNMVHGMSPAEVRQDLEGMQVMRILGQNMAWLLRSIEAGRAAGIDMPPQEHITPTNFIR